MSSSKSPTNFSPTPFKAFAAGSARRTRSKELSGRSRPSLPRRRAEIFCLSAMERSEHCCSATTQKSPSIASVISRRAVETIFHFDEMIEM